MKIQWPDLKLPPINQPVLIPADQFEKMRKEGDMKVILKKDILKKTMTEQIVEARESALCDNREIEKIVLTRAEAKQLEREVGPYLPTIGTGTDYRQTKVMGIIIEVERPE